MRLRIRYAIGKKKQTYGPLPCETMALFAALYKHIDVKLTNRDLIDSI